MNNMRKVLSEWFDHNDFPKGVYSYRETPPSEVMEWYAKVSDCLNQIDSGETMMDNRKSKITVIWNLVNFLNIISDELSHENHEYTIQTHIKLYFMLFREMSFLTYREILILFPLEH